MKKFLPSLALLVLLGAGCLSSEVSKTETAVYSNTDLGFAVSYPVGWDVQQNGAPDPALIVQTYFQPAASKGGSYVSIWVFSDDGNFYTDEAGQAGAVTGKLGENFYVINSVGDIAQEDFDLIMGSFRALPL